MLYEIIIGIIFIGIFITSLWLITYINSEKSQRMPIKKYPAITLLIPAYNEEKGIEKTIKSVKNQIYPGQIKITVIDDASTDTTLSKIKKHKDINIISLKKNMGKPAAMNKALTKTKTEYFGVVDADSKIEKNSVKKAIEKFYETGSAHGAVISKMQPQNTENTLIERVQTIEYMMVGFVRYIASKLKILHVTPGVLSIYKTDVVKSLNGFDEKNLTEDFELAVRIRKNNHTIGYSEESKVYTTTPDTLSKLLKQRVRWYRGFFQTHKKHKEIYFRKKFGLFGLYEFPVAMLSILTFIIGLVILTINITKSIYQTIFMLIYTPDLIYWFEWRGFNELLLSADYQLLIPLLTALTLTFIIINLTFKFYNIDFMKKNKLKKLTALTTYILIYNYMYVYVLINSLYKELTNKKRTWGTK